MTLRGALALQLRADEKAHVRSTLRFSLHVNLGHRGAPRCFTSPTWKILFNLGWALTFWAIRPSVVVLVSPRYAIRGVNLCESLPFGFPVG